MFHHETADTERFEQAILQAVRQMLASPFPEPYFDWASATLPDLLDLSAHGLDERESRRLANLLATAVWNAAPQPHNGFRPAPLVPPLPNRPCRCGSGERFGDCCGLDDLPELSSELVWELLLDELPDRALNVALASGEVPRLLHAKIADRWLNEDRPGRAVRLLEPLFESDLATLGGELEPAVDLLCDAYDRLDRWRKKRAFLECLCREASRPLQVVAWQRRCTISIDEGDFSGAEDAFAAALRSDPGNPSNALLEITLLAAQRKDAIASQRARFWLARFRRLGLADRQILDLLERAVRDPQRALLDSHLDCVDPVLVRLSSWVDSACTRQLPDYRLAPVVEPDRDAPKPERDRRDRSPGRSKPGIGAEATLAPQVRCELRVPNSVRDLEASWRNVRPAGKPMSTQLIPSGENQLWLKTDWTNFLLAHPEAADSLDVLDDLASAVYVHPDSSLPWVAHALLAPLVERAWEILRAAVPADSAHRLPWSRECNRPALRLLFRRYLLLLEERRDSDAVSMLETLLRLDPLDNHGARGELMNHYLRSGEDDKALELAGRFPDDALADLAYGEVLALYRLGERDRASAALRTAARRLPRIPPYLTRKRIKQPSFAPLGADPSGEDQAWLYREAMRDVWEKVPGVLSWMKRLTA